MRLCFRLPLRYPVRYISMEESLPRGKDQPPKTHEKMVAGRSIIVTEAHPFDVDVAKIDVSRFGAMAGQVELALSIIAEWIQMPSIYDGFTDHLKRVEWEKSIDPSDREWLNNHHYRGNSWAPVLMWLAALPSKLSADPALAERVKTLTASLSDIQTRTKRARDEGTVARDVYVAAVDEMDEMAREVLTAIAKA